MPTNSQAFRHSRGVTLIELMIVIAIVAILANVALPAYTSYVQRGKVGEAFSNLSQMRIQLEQYYQDHAQDTSTTTKGYGSSTTACGGASAIPDATTANTSCTITSQYFKYTCNSFTDGTNSGTDTYVLTATGCGGMSGYQYTLDYKANKKTLKFNGTDYSGNPKTCWWLKSGDC